MNKDKRYYSFVFYCCSYIPITVIYFTSPIYKLVCAYTFSDDNTASLLSVMEKYKEGLKSTRNNLILTLHYLVYMLIML